MSDNNALKGIGAAAIFSLLMVRACKSCDDAAKAAGKKGADFSCTPKKVEPEVVIPSRPPDPVPPRPPDVPPEPVKPVITVSYLAATDIFEEITNIKNAPEDAGEILESAVFKEYRELLAKAPEHSYSSMRRDKRFYEQEFQEYERVRNQLLEAFESDDCIYLSYLKRSLKQFKNYGETFPSHSSVDDIIPDYLIEPSNKINLNTYYLYTGVKLNTRQQELLTELTSYGFTSQKRDLDNCVVIERNGGGFLIRSLTGETKAVSPTSRLDEITDAAHKNILVKGALPEDLVAWLRSNKVRIVADAMKFFDIINLERRQIKLLAIIPEKDADLMEFYGLGQNQVAEMRTLLDDFASTPNTEVIRSKEQLQERLWQAYDESPVVIFHNESGNLFDEPLQNYHSLKNVITCNSYSLESSNLAFNSTDFLYIRQTFNALKKTPFQQKMRLDEFYLAFSGNYNREMMTSHQNKVFNVVLVGVGGVGVVTGAVYLGHKQKTKSTI